MDREQMVEDAREFIRTDPVWAWCTPSEMRAHLPKFFADFATQALKKERARVAERLRDIRTRFPQEQLSGAIAGLIAQLEAEDE